MRLLVKRLLGRVSKNQAGFTLVELLVVVGIIVALAAVVMTRVTGFAGAGDQASAESERDMVQAALDTMMVDQGITTVDATTVYVNDFTVNPTGTGTVPLYNGYLREGSTSRAYCWNSTGEITGQASSPGGACP